MAHVLNIIPYITAQAFIIEKAKKCLDYTITTFFIHTMIIWRYTGHFPWTFNYYFMHGIIITITVLCAEFVLMRIESAEIKLSFDVDGITTAVEQGRQVLDEVSEKVKKIQTNLNKKGKQMMNKKQAPALDGSVKSRAQAITNETVGLRRKTE